MTDRGSYGPGPRLDAKQLFLEAQHRWLRPAEICEILRNYQQFHISSESPSKPPSGSLFLFNRKVLRYFRKDGHNWRKKKDGKTVKEAHEKLKVGSVDMLHCYYAHGEENENFQRRSYWMLEQDLMHIVFVHYLEIKGNRTNSSPSSSFAANRNIEASGNTDSTSPTSTLNSLCEDADSADSHSISRYQSFPESLQLQNNPLFDKVNAGILSSHVLHPGSDKHGQPLGHAPYIHEDGLANNDNCNHIMRSQSLPSWEEVFEQCTTGYSSLPPGNNSLHISEGFMDPALETELPYDLGTKLYEQRTHEMNPHNILDPFYPVQQNEQMQRASAETQHVMHPNSDSVIHVEENRKLPFIVRQPLLDGEEGLKKVDSFSRWITRNLGEVDDLNMRSSSGLSWSTVVCGNIVVDSSLSPSLSQDQLFSINEFSPKWVYADSETEVYITGKFLKSGLEVAKYNWSCMFGEVEVPAEVLLDGVLCCYAPAHSVAIVPFYVTCSNRLACSEVREFEYRAGSVEDIDIGQVSCGSAEEMCLYLRLERLLSLKSVSPPDNLLNDAEEIRKLISKIILLKEEDGSYQISEPTSNKDLSGDEVKKQLVQRQMKGELYIWLLRRVTEGGKGLTVLDDDGQGLLHLTAALGFDWAMKPIVTAGVSINFRDVNGWTALHWAAFYGREQTVAVLISLGAAPGALTDPSPESPLGRTPADLASCNGHKGISGFLAESSLTSYLSSLTMNDPKEVGVREVSRTKAVQTVSERTATPVNDGDVPDALSLKDSLTAISNATQAAHRIYQFFRMQSFQRKTLAECGDEFQISNEHALSVVVGKASKSAHFDRIAHAAAIQIQKKFRGWKKRKEFLIIRQRIVKIQAHVRGHQVRKQYKTFIWSVGVVEKIILRWRRKRSGLRGFHRDAPTKDFNLECMISKEDDYDFLKEGRKQNEERQQKALSRVKSMFHNPEGRAQYRRLLTVAEKLRETQVCNMVLSNSEETSDVEEELIDFDALLDDALSCQ